MIRPKTLAATGGTVAQLLLAASAAAFGHVVDAQAQTREQLDVSIGGTAGTNPFLLPGEDTEAASATITIDPAIFMEDEVTTFAVQGQVRLQQYTTRYGTDASARLTAGGTTRLNERTSLSSTLGIRSSRSATQDVFVVDGGDLLDLPPETFPEVPLPDVTAAGRRTRLNTINATASIDHVLSPLERLSFGINGGYTDADEFGDHRTAGLQASYRRQVSARTSTSATANFGRAVYIDRAGGDGSYLTQMVGIAHQFDENTSVSAQVGATFTSIETATGDQEKDVGLAVSFDLCDRRLRRALCASASRQARPTAFGGVSTVSSLGLSYSAEVGQGDRIALSGRYGRSESIVEDLLFPDRETEVLALSSRYSHRLNDRLSAFLAPSFTRANSDRLTGSRSNFQVEIGIRLRIGALR